CDRKKPFSRELLRALEQLSHLVPKLRLGTPFRDTLFRGRARRHETEFRGMRSQTEFGNEEVNTLYKLLLCWRYLLTRYLAVACVISVLVGGATLIVVNGVMAGFSAKLKDRLHRLISDVIVESFGYEGFPDPNGKMARIANDPFLRDKIEAMTPTMDIFAMLQFQIHGETVTRPVHVIGIDPKGRTAVGGFSEYLVRQRGFDKPSFDLGPEAQLQFQLNNPPQLAFNPIAEPLGPDDKPPPDPPPAQVFVPHGIIVGYALAHVRDKKAHADSKDKDFPLMRLGDDITITTVSGAKMAPVTARFTVVDFIKTEMSEYDGNYVFVPLDYLQHIRTMQDRATAIQIRLKDFREAKEVVDYLRSMFPKGMYQVSTWEDKQGPLLGAIAIEKGLLNILL